MSDLFVDAIGAFTAAGGDVPSVMGAALTGFQLFEDLDLAGPDGELLGGAITPLPRSLTAMGRLSALGFLALGECAEGEKSAPAPLIIVAPTAAELDADPDRLLDGIIGADAALPIDRSASRVIPRGRQGIGEALKLAFDLLTPGRWQECYVLGVDSLVTGKRLRRLAKDGLIVHSGNPDGLVPGEAAAVLRVSLRRSEGALAVILGFGTAEEPGARPDRSAPVTGTGLALAAERAISDAGRARPIEILAGMIPDRLAPQRHLDELALARLHPPLAGIDAGTTLTPALSAGETGAASSVLGLATLAFFIDKGVIGGAGVCLFTGDDEWRGAAVIGPAAEKKGRRRHA